MNLSKGDMRKVLNILQSTSMAFDVVNEENVYTCVGQPQRADIQSILEILLSCKDFQQAFEGISITSLFSSKILLITKAKIYVDIKRIKLLKGLALEDILTELHLMIMRGKDHSLLYSY